MGGGGGFRVRGTASRGRREHFPVGSRAAIPAARRRGSPCPAPGTRRVS